jgi:hypothetical protein
MTGGRVEGGVDPFQGVSKRLLGGYYGNWRVWNRLPLDVFRERHCALYQSFEVSFPIHRTQPPSTNAILGQRS